MKKVTAALLAALLLTGCQAKPAPEIYSSESIAPETESVSIPESNQINAYHSRFDTVTEVTLSDNGICVNNGGETAAVFTTRDIIYYENLEAYNSGNPYGEGTENERHTPEEAAAHTVVNITQPGAYRITGKLSAGQIRVDLGEDCYHNKDAVVELILEDADITCTVAPAILFLNTYECDENWSSETAQAEVDTTAAGANLILEGSNVVSGSHVAKIFKDTDDEKKLWKQDGAIYSYRSMNVFGPGSLELTADNEGLDTELHLTINGGNIHIYSDNDGINTNEDGVSVTTINGGNLTIFAGLGEEGDGIDSNGYLVINGGSVMAAANPKADAGLDSDLGSYIHGGTVIAMGSTMDWAESDSEQVTMNLQFSQQQKAGSKITVTKEDRTEIFSFEDSGSLSRNFSGLILSHPYFSLGKTYHVYVDGVQMAYTGTDVGRGGPGGMGPRAEMPEGMEPGAKPEPPENFDPIQMDPRGPHPEGDDGNRIPPEGFLGEIPEDMEPPEGFHPEQFNRNPGESRTDFYMNDKVNAFSGVAHIS